jgi:hypothetical protein
VTEIVDLIYQTYFYGIQPMGMKDSSLTNKINATFIACIVTPIHHCLSALKTGESWVPPEFGPEGGEQ